MTSFTLTWEARTFRVDLAAGRVDYTGQFESGTAPCGTNGVRFAPTKSG